MWDVLCTSLDPTLRHGWNAATTPGAGLMGARCPLLGGDRGANASGPGRSSAAAPHGACGTVVYSRARGISRRGLAKWDEVSALLVGNAAPGRRFTRTPGRAGRLPRECTHRCLGAQPSLPYTMSALPPWPLLPLRVRLLALVTRRPLLGWPCPGAPSATEQASVSVDTLPGPCARGCSAPSWSAATHEPVHGERE